MAIRVKDMPKIKRPREKLYHFGHSNLKDEELLAIILGTGNRGENVVSLARRILREFSLVRLSEASIKELTRIKGIGKVKATKVISAFELGRRTLANDVPKSMISPEDILHEVSDIRNKSSEHLVALYLNARFHLINKTTVGKGSLTTSVIEPRDIFAPALSLPCANIIIVHNHPSGDSSPSDADKGFTDKVKEAGDILGVTLVDHLIVAKKNYYSFKENMLL